ncbi:hypothetical protein [Ornithinimicrobium sp. W1665]|uniref:hypothetical protein n=1 Tax=Ornithinimicrobium sp. W1665 TaxID=3416666 RepID=UPI003D6BB666
MLLLIVLALGVLWWVVTTPAGEQAGTPTTPAVREDPGTPGQEPPTDLADEEVWLADVDIAAGTVVLPDSTLRDVQAVGRGVRSGGEGLVVDDLEVQATVPFADVASELGGDSVVRPADDGQASVVRTVEVLGRELTAVATGTVEVVDGLLVVEPRAIDIGGPDVLSHAPSPPSCAGSSPSSIPSRGSRRTWCCGTSRSRTTASGPTCGGRTWCSRTVARKAAPTPHWSMRSSWPTRAAVSSGVWARRRAMGARWNTRLTAIVGNLSVRCNQEVAPGA